MSYAYLLSTYVLIKRFDSSYLEKTDRTAS